MAAVARRYQPSWKLGLELNELTLSHMGLTVTDSVEESDTTTNIDEGFSDAEAGVRTVTISCSVNLPAGGVRPAIEAGDLYAGTVTTNDGVTVYDGTWLVTAFNLNGTIRGTAKLDLSIRNSGSVKPTP